MSGWSMRNKPLIFSGNSNPELARKVCAHYGIDLGRMMVQRFSDGEVRVEIQEAVRGRDVFVLQSSCPPVNDHLVELLVLLNTFKQASAGRITAVIPYYGYGRQDQKERPRVPIAARLTADLISVAGADRVVAFDLHADQIEGFFDVPVDNIRGTDMLLDAVSSELQGGEIVVAPDEAGVQRARGFAKRLQVDLAIMDHRGHEHHGRSRIVGEVKGRRVVILDDIVDTGRTLLQVSEEATAAGAVVVDAYCVHGVFSGHCVERLDGAPLRSLTVTDTIPLGEKQKRSPKIRSVSVAPVLASIIRSVHNEESVSALFQR
jgi:ribose-phosphate pyrophosphokinase